jgi:radical SAM superfamily enzyme YgiQ (UPF0313 family)
MKCTFCELPNRDVFHAYNKRHRSLEGVMSDIHEYVRRWKINFVTIVDSIATLNTDLIEGFIRRMDDELPGVGFMFNGHANRFSRRLAETVGAAQTGRPEHTRITTWFGFESGSQRLLDFMKKQTTVAKGLTVAALCHEHDVQIGANLLLGLPTETDEDYRQHLEFMDAVNPTFPNPNILNPLPGTEMYDYCAEHGIMHDPLDRSIWSHEKIRTLGRGPLQGVDYGRVLDTYYRFHPDLRPPGPAYKPWAEQA